MIYAVRVTEDYIGIMGRHVAEGQRVTPGAPLIDIMTPEGIVETIFSKEWGTIAHIEGGRIFFGANSNEREEDDDEDDEEDGESGSARSSSGGMGMVFSKGDLICQIAPPKDGHDAGTIRGLTPRPTNVMARRYARSMGLN